jgi:Domain of unknown function (DUF4436)
MFFCWRAAVLYSGVFAVLYSHAAYSELEFAEPGSTTPLNIYVTMIDMDPVREELRVHLDFATEIGPHGKHFPGVPRRDVTVHVGDGSFVQDIALKAQQSASPITLRISLRGFVSDYPFDLYEGRISVSAFEKVMPQPLRLTVWPAMSQWTVGIEQTDPAATSNPGVDLAIRITRPTPFVVIAVAVYTAMAVVGLSGLMVGALVFLGVRRVEATLTGTLSAMIFAVPALRSSLPGVPPLGGHADIVVLAVIIGLILFMIAWMERGPSPES